MASISRTILEAGLAAQAAAIAGRNLQLLRKKKKKARHFLGAATDTLVGTSLLSAQADIIGQM